MKYTVKHKQDKTAKKGNFKATFTITDSNNDTLRTFEILYSVKGGVSTDFIIDLDKNDITATNKRFKVLEAYELVAKDLDA